MRKIVVILIFFLTFNVYSQYTAKVSDFHEIPVEDTLTKNTIERYVYYMNTNPVNYEKYIREIKEVKMVKEDRYYIGELKDGILYLNKQLNAFPNTKRAIILQYLASNNGMKLEKKSFPHVKNTQFYINDRTEEMFFRQFRAKTPYTYIVGKLKERAPLKYKR